MKIGILGGTFDPIHNGHLIGAEYARSFLKLDKIIFIPSGVHPFKNNKKITSSNKRIEMCNLAIESNKNFEISLLEINRKGTNYTIDTIKDIKAKKNYYDIYFIIGTDIIYEIDRWKKIDELAKMCRFVLLDRYENISEETKERINNLKSNYEIHIEIVDSPVIEISSTEIRNRIKENLSIKYLVPDLVESYIVNNGLYKDDKNEG